MKQQLSTTLKTLTLAGCLLALPMQGAIAATPTQKCALGELNVVGKLVKGQLKSLAKVCLGKKTAAEEAVPLTKKFNKGINKLNKRNDKLDCVTNSDPDGLGIVYPLEPAEVADVQPQLEDFAAACDGVVTEP